MEHKIDWYVIQELGLYILVCTLWSLLLVILTMLWLSG